MVEWYSWIKAFHIIVVVAWMAGLFYLPRLFVYHCGVLIGSETSELFKIMERRLLAVIMRPALIAVVLSGGVLLGMGGYSLATVWVSGKLVAVLLMTVFHGFLETSAVSFANDIRIRNAKFFRIINEIPTLLLVIIVVLVVLKPA